MSNTPWDPIHREDIPESKQEEVAGLALMSQKLEGLIKLVPNIAANTIVLGELTKLHREVKGTFNRVKAEIVREMTPDE